MTGGGGSIPYQTVAGTTDISTTSTSFVDIDQMTLTVAEGGTYLILFSICVRAFATTETSSMGFFLRLLKNSDLVGGCRNAIELMDYLISEWTSVAVVSIVRSLAAGDVVKAQWRRASGIRAFTIYNTVSVPEQYHRQLTIIQLTGPPPVAAGHTKPYLVLTLP